IAATVAARISLRISILLGGTRIERSRTGIVSRTKYWRESVGPVRQAAATSPGHAIVSLDSAPRAAGAARAPSALGNNRSRADVPAASAGINLFRRACH